MNIRLLSLITLFVSGSASAQESFFDHVDPFIGTTNFGTTNPGAVTPNGLMSVVTFNVLGSDVNLYD